MYRDEKGNAVASTQPHDFMGTAADGRFLYARKDEAYDLDDGGDTYVYAWDPATDEVEELLKIENGYLLSTNPYDNMIIYLVDHGNQFYYAVVAEDGENRTVCKYDMRTGQSTELGYGPRSEGFAFRGAYGDWFIGNFYEDSGTRPLYAIRREDYERWNFDAAKMLKGLK